MLYVLNIYKFFFRKKISLNFLPFLVFFISVVSMKWRIFFLLTIAVNTTISKKYNKLPCAFLESVNITDGIIQPDKSVIFENVTYTKYSYITYTLENNTIRHKTAKYVRGCKPATEIKPFLRLHCPFGMNDKDCPSYQNVRNFQQKVRFHDGNETIVTLDQHFGFLFDRPCGEMASEEIAEITYVMFYTFIVLLLLLPMMFTFFF